MIDIFLLTTDNDLDSVVDEFLEQFPQTKIIKTDNRIVTKNLLFSMLGQTMTSHFYLVTDANIDLVDDFDFSFKPNQWELDYVHVWDNSPTIRLYSRSKVESNVIGYTDASFASGNVDFKNHEQPNHKVKDPDIIFLSYDEPFADDNYYRILSKHNRIKRVHGVKGIYEAHKQAAKVARTSMFYVVDADAILLDFFKFDYMPNNDSERNYVHVWKSRNPINGLEYGNGGVKLLPTNAIRKAKYWNIDFATSVADGFQVMDEVSNITSINTSPFNAWKSAFRECTKLAASTIKNSNVIDTLTRLDTWCNKGQDNLYGTHAINGATQGKEYGLSNINDTEALNKINDFAWLFNRYSTMCDDENTKSKQSAMENYKRYFVC